MPVEDGPSIAGALLQPPGDSLPPTPSTCRGNEGAAVQSTGGERAAGSHGQAVAVTFVSQALAIHLS